MMKRIIALLLTTTLIVGLMPLYSHALESDTSVAEEETQENDESQEPTDEAGSDVEPEENEEPADTTSDEQVIADEPVITDEQVITEEQANVVINKTYMSQTKNMVGVAFVNALSGTSSKNTGVADPDKYPREHHDRSYYGDSLRVRVLGDVDDPDANFLVYRESFLIFSETDSINYNVTYSDDGKTATVSPAISINDIVGKTGIVFLADSLGNDTILVFDEADAPSVGGNGELIVPLQDEDSIAINQLFSDGKLRYSAKSVGFPGIDWNSDIQGTNWSGEITDFEVNDISASLDFDIWNGGFEINFNFDFTVDYDITTTGSSGGKENARVAKITIPIDVFTAIYTFDMVVDFDETPMNVKGDLRTNFNYGISVLGANINHFETPAKISELTPSNEADYNKDIKFYIGSQLNSELAIIYVEILGYEFGPVLSLNFVGNGGRYFTANFAKDQFDKPDPKATSVHVCAQDGEDGCLGLSYEEKQGFNLHAVINLYFDSFPINLYSDETTVDSGDLHNSYTIGYEWQDGPCPYIGYRIDVTVNDNMKTSTEGAFVSYSPVIDGYRKLSTDTVDGSNKATLFAPADKQFDVTAEITSPHDSTWKISQTLTLDKTADVQALEFMLEIPQKHVYFKNSQSGTAEGMPKDIVFAPFFNENVKLPGNIPTLAGRQFTGWNTAEDGSGTTYSTNSVLTLSDDITLWAQWEMVDNNWYVVYDANGGKSAPATQMGIKGDSIVLTTDLPDGGALVFRGWALEENAADPDYQPGDTLPYDSTKNAVVLYALWEIDPEHRPVIVSFDANGGHSDSLPNNISIPHLTWGILPDKAPVWDLSHQFLGWSDDPQATEAKWEPGSTVFFSQDTVLYAVWKNLPTPLPPVPATGEELSSYTIAGIILVTMSGVLVFVSKKRLFFSSNRR